MLRDRVLSALILAPPALAAILWLPPTGFAVMVALIFALGAWEWARLSGFNGTGRLLSTAFMLLLMAGALQTSHARESEAAMIAATALSWLVLPLWFLRPGKASGTTLARRLFKLLLGCWIILGSFIAVVWLRQQGDPNSLLNGSEWIFMLLFLIWSADIGAYFSGRRLGRHKLAPAISPGKTWEGVLGGLLLALATGWSGNQLLQLLPAENTLPWLGLTALVAVISVVGDLIISLLKRQAHLKDSSNLIPGHGGILDRFDSLFSASPWLALGLLWLK